ncbi:hypothetical protein CG08_2091 [Riemerella anatipestifer]|nr:hypothetical protein RIA_0303 [Riemerella anatipestifer RA-GD]AGC41011.1 hypothetical protein G148_1707 [Riemerella anatipestifer RA-CH-2]AKP70166.1 hypothetical protein CG08_2091 [Riemerella anatipestifer]AKP72145.1 hypothetical protein CG09_2057 [Riemerella anatipestifer]
MNNMLETPPTVRLPRPDELPNNPEVFERLKELENANIVEGYKLSINTAHDLPFKFYVEINIDNSRLWDLFKALTNQLPDNLSCIYNLYGEEAIFSVYKDKNIILKQLECYKTELTQDCNLEFGLIYQADDKLEEVFVSDSKFLKVWGNNEISFRQLMNDFRLNEISDLNFIDEFPKVVESLTMFNKKAKRTEAIIEELDEFFNPKKTDWKL